MKKIISVIMSLLITAAVFAGTGIFAAGRSGDTNGDGTIDNKDVVTLFRFVSGNKDGAIAENCDFNGDGEVNNKDVAALFRAVSSGIIPEETVEETTLIDFNTAIDKNIVSFFTKTSSCEVTAAEDEEEGKVIRVSTKDVVSPNTRTPSVIFLYKNYSESIGEKSVSFVEKPFVIMKIKAENLHDRMFKLTGAKSESSSMTSLNESSVRISGGDGWQYICLDFSNARNADVFGVFRITFENLAGGNGESILLSEIRICTEEEAEGYMTKDVYTVQEQTADDYKLKVMQFNVQTENGNGAPFITRAEMYRDLIDELQPDVVGMQEVTVSWRQWLDSYVFNGSYAGVGEARSTDASKGIEANPIYYRKDKFDLIDYGTFWLSDTPDVEGSVIATEVDGVTYTSNYPRICTWVVLKDKTTGVQFVHLNTHLDHNGSNGSSGGNAIRKKQMGVIIKFAQRFDKSTPMFLTGDFNNRRTTSEGKTYALIKMIQGDSQFTDTDGKKYSIALSDARLNAPLTVDEDHTATMTKYYDESNSAYNPSYEPIDYIFYNGASMNALTYNTYLITEYGSWISDHLPLFATFRVNPAE